MADLKSMTAIRALLPLVTVLLFVTGCASLMGTRRTDSVAERVSALLSSGEKVSLVITCEGSKSISDEQLRKMNVNPEGYIAGVCSDVMGKVESGYLNAFRNSEGFSLVERSRLKQILEEQKLSVSGAISASSQLRLGEIIGATHMLAITEVLYGRDSQNPVAALLDGFNQGLSGQPPPVYIGETRTIRLIDLRTGKIVESAQFEF